MRMKLLPFLAAAVLVLSTDCFICEADQVPENLEIRQSILSLRNALDKINEKLEQMNKNVLELNENPPGNILYLIYK